MGIIAFFVQILRVFILLIQVILNCNTHYAKAKLYKAQGRHAWVKMEEDMEGVCIHMLTYVDSALNPINVCLGWISCIWSCVGLSMLCFGLGGSVQVVPGYNDS